MNRLDATKIEPVREIYRIQNNLGQKYYSRRKPGREDEIIIETISFKEYLYRNGANVNFIDKHRNLLD